MISPDPTAEAAVLIVERWLLGRLRHRRFYSLAELNAAIGELLRQLNEERPIRRLLLLDPARAHDPFGRSRHAKGAGLRGRRRALVLLQPRRRPSGPY